MPINTITNNTGAVLELWDVGVQLAVLNNGQSIQNLPTTITQITYNNVIYANKIGGFLNGESYLATRANIQVNFTGSNNTVVFS